MKALAYLEQGIHAGLHPGAQLFIKHRGEVVADFAVGEARPGVAMLPETSQFWYSCTKPVAVVAVMQQVERGRLRLDDPIARHIPEFAVHGKESIDLLQILTHTAGIRGANQVEPEWGWERILQHICEARIEPGWVPGQRAGYHSHTSWFLLGEIVQRLEGVPFSRHVRAGIFEPLGLSASWLGMPPEAFSALGDLRGGMFVTAPGVASTGSVWDDARDSIECRPGSNGRGPARELGRFMEMLLRGGEPLLRSSTVDLMVERHRQGLLDETFQQVIDWGLGMILRTVTPGQTRAPYGFGEHAGDRAFGHGGMQSSMAFVDPGHNLVVCWICNGMCGERLHRERNHRINTLIYEDLGLA